MVKFCTPVLVVGTLLGLVKASRAADTHAPLIFLPGLAGSVLEERLNRTEALHWYCSSQHDWQIMWLSITAASRLDCFLDELLVKYDPETKTYANASGVEIRPYDFGGIDGIYSIDPSLPSATGTYKVILDKLISAGYKPGQDLFGAPYDFRLAADGLVQVGWFARLQQLVEHAVQQNNNRRAVFVAHSMGCLVSLYFLTRQSPDWRSKNVAGLVAISAPWEGSVTALKGSISGDNFDVSGVPHDLLRPVQSTAPSAPWLFPTPDVWGDKVLVRTKSSNYTGSDIPRLLLDLFLEQQAAVYHVTRNLTYPLPPLDMPVYCLHGTGVDTDESFFYDVDRFDHNAPPAPKNITKGDGDGTVPLVSLEACSKLGAQVVIKRYDGAEHTGILGDDRMVADLLGILHSKGATGNQLQHYVRGVIANLRGLWSSDTSYKAQRRHLAA